MRERTFLKMVSEYFFFEDEVEERTVRSMRFSLSYVFQILAQRSTSYESLNGCL